jgi:mRNA interferase HigB
MRRFAVRIISRRTIREACEQHAEWEASLTGWYRIVKAAKWDNFLDVRQTLNTADSVGNCVVFNVSHNPCRLVSYINYKAGIVYILHILSHVEYGKDGWKNDCDCD